VTTRLLDDALAITNAWSKELNLHHLIRGQILEADLNGLDVDVIAMGKAAREMAAALHDILGERVQRQLVIVDEGPALSFDSDVEIVIGEHPLPGLGSLMAGERLVEFLEGSNDAACTIFLISGGASSLCVFPQSPMEIEDLHGLFAAVLESGANITTLNQLRAASSGIAGGAILRRVRTSRSLALIMVDNVVSGERWVASGLTFDFRPAREDVDALLQVIGRGSGQLAETIQRARENRGEVMNEPIATDHENRVVAQPSDVLSSVVNEAARRGYQVIELGSSLHGDVQDLVARVTESLLSTSSRPVARCVVGVGEATTRVRGSGVGGRCQEFAWRMAEAFGGSERGAVAAARATDGRDYVQGIAGGWSDNETMRRALEHGIDYSRVIRDNDSYTALHELGQIIPGGRTGWNLCDVYFAAVDAS
jgi:glycerate 2-kinase